MTRYEMRQHAENPPRMRWDDDFEPDWRHGLLAVLAFLVMLGWLDAKDNEAFYREAAEKAHRDAQEARQELEGGAHVRWVGKGYRCQYGNIKREWHQVLSAECTRTGNILQAARATP